MEDDSLAAEKALLRSWWSQRAPRRSGPISCPIFTTISETVIPRYRGTRYCIRYWHRYRVSPDIVSDIDTDIGKHLLRYRDTRYWSRYITRYRVLCIRYRCHHDPISECTRYRNQYRTRYRITCSMIRYRITRKTRYRVMWPDMWSDIGAYADIGGGKVPDGGTTPTLRLAWTLRVTVTLSLTSGTLRYMISYMIS